MQKLSEILITAGIVAIPLLAFSIVSIALIVERIAFWYRVNRRPLFFANTFRGFYLRQVAMIQEYSAELELLYRCRCKPRLEVSYATTFSCHCDNRTSGRACPSSCSTYHS